ncbi:host specificity protein [Pseudomonas putida LF54]|jgi:predicted phage tail protein|uniref:phage tail protein n=1 Tax=Pseudomonas TaxID=286 RepID=UPI0003AE851E|nr:MULTISPECIES: phage tail protein [Pseudomonas]ERK99237.1 host specificity protein [Pseudomonas putida LF54]MDX3740147.1 phage tail protein [Pseudomonas sp.]
MGPTDHLDITGAKGGESKPKSPVEAPDSLQSTNIAKLLLAVGEGEFDGTPTDREIYLDNTPIMDTSGNVNFPGVKWEWRRGTIEQDYIQGIPSVENETTVNVELRSDNPFTRALSNIQLSAVRVRMSWPRLAKQDSSGNTNGYRIEYAIDIATDGGAYAEAHRGAVDGKTTNGYQRSVRVNLPAATSGWMLRVRRITPNANSGTVADTMTIAGYTEIIDEKLRYPNTALLYIEFDAQQFQNIPAVTVKCKAKRWPVPTNYDPVTRTYTGVWDGTFKQAWTNNPAFVTYGLCVEDRFGLGKRIKSWMVDKWEMYRIAQYCDQLVPNGQGGQEPRFLCDMNLQGRAEAWTLLRDLSAIYRGMVYWAHGSLFMQADMPRAQDIDYVFTRANVIDGEFVYGGAERNTHYSRALVSYDNPANNYDTDVIPVTDLALQRRYRDRPIEISAIGCTRASEAQRRGRWALLSNSQDRTVSFKTGMEGRIPLPGYVIPVADELVAGRPNGGRISSAAGRVVTLDRDTPIKAGDRLIVNLPNGTAQARTVQSVAGRAVTVTTEYSVQPEPELQWAIDYDDLAVQLFRVLKTTRTQEGEYEITALEFNPSKFAAIDTGAKLDERPISVIPVTTVAPPASVSLTSAYAVDQGIAVSTMTISWPAVQGAVAYDVEWRKDNGNWTRLQRTGATSIDVVGIYAGSYLARVRAVSSFDITSIWRDSTLTELKGKEGTPPSVTYLTADPLIFGISLKWGIPPGAEDTQRTEIWYGPTNSLEAATKLADLAYPQTEYVMQGLKAGVSFFFWARLVDRTGNIGPWYPIGGGVFGQSGADASPVLELITGKITESELGQNLLSEIEKISGEGPESVNGRIEAAKQELEDLITDLTDPLEYVATNAYAKDDAVRSGQRLYMAIAPVPAAANGSNAPPNPAYWVDIGSIASTANGLAQAVAKNTTDIATVDGKVTVNAAMLQAVQSAYRDENPEGALTDALRGWDTLAKVSEESRTRATQNEAMASRMTTVETSVGETNGSIRSLEQTVVTNEQATASRFLDVNTKVGANSASLSVLEKTVTDNESSTASRLQTVNARVDYANQALDQEKLDRDNAVTGERQAREAAVENEATARADGDEALGLLVDTVSAQVDENASKIQTVEHAQADTDQAVASMRTTIGAVYTTGRDDNAEGELAGSLKAWESTAKIAEESKTRATAIDAQAKKTETLEVSFNSALDRANGEIQKTSASVQVTSQALAALDDKASTMWSVKMQVNAQGQYVAAGIGLGIENGPAGLQSKFLVSADLFAVVNGINGTLSSPFAVQGGQVFMNEAFIQDGTITNAKIGSYISSTNYVAGQQGWILNKSGTFEINGTVAGQGRLLINNQRLRIYHANGNLAIDLGVSV